MLEAAVGIISIGLSVTALVALESWLLAEGVSFALVSSSFVMVLIAIVSAVYHKTRIYQWIARRYWGLHNIAKNHRQLFANSLVWNYEFDERGPWEVEEKGEVYDCFTRCFKNEFGVDLTRSTDEPMTDRIRRLYPLVTSNLSTSEASLSSRFQAIYSFCRSMWMVFLILFSIYGTIIIPFYLSGSLLYPNSGVGRYSESAYPIFLVLLALGAFVFMIGAGFYKRHYVDYLMADFCTVYRKSLPFGDEFK